MPNQVGFVDNSSVLAHYAMLQAIRDFAFANGWTILRYDTAPANRELIMMAPGLSGTEETYVGIRTYQDVAADYYNLCVAGFTGYVSGNTFDTQPGVRLSGVPAHNQHIDYWMTINGQRLAIGMKVGTPVYESLYIGKFLPYATPTQYPYPLAVVGMLSGAAATRYSDVNHSMGYKGNTAAMAIRWLDGSYVQARGYPWGNNMLMNSNSAANGQIRPSGTTYPLMRVVLHDNATNVYGELDGIYSITGFDNVVENTLTIGGVNYVVIQDVARTGFIDYYAMRLDPNP